MAELLKNGSIKMRNGRILWGKDPVQIIDIREISELLVPKPAPGFAGFGGGGGGGRGERGFQGPAGSGGGGAGTQGNQGPAGPAGGPQGNQGNQGIAGVGTQGPQGFQGAVGTGVQGPQGVAGVGTQGNQGFQGGLNPDIYAATRVVSLAGDGTDLTIAAAIAALPAAGGKIFVKQGVYAIAATLLLTGKPISIEGAGEGATVVDVGANPIAAFTCASAHDFTIANLTVTGAVGPSASKFVAMTASCRLKMNQVRSTNVLVILDSTAASPNISLVNCDFVMKNEVGSLFAATSISTTLECTDVFSDAVGGSTAGGITGSPTTILTGCRLGVTSGFALGPAFLTNCVFTGSVVGTACTLGLRSLVTGVYWAFCSVTSGVETQISSSIFEGGPAQAVELLILNGGASAVGCFFRENNVAGMTTTTTISGSDAEIADSRFVPFGLATLRAIDITGVVVRARVTGNTFNPYVNEQVRIAGGDCTVTGNADCKVTELAGADQNTYANNTGFTGSTIISTSNLTRVEEARRQLNDAVATVDALTVVFTHTNPKGLAGAGSIKNTGGVNSLRVRRTGTDGYGTTDFQEDVVLPGATLVWPMDTALGTALPEFVSFTVSVRSEVAGNPTTFNLRHTSHAALI